MIDFDITRFLSIRVKLYEEYSARRNKDKFYIISNEKDFILEINETAYEMLKLVDGEKTLNEIVSKLSIKYGVEKDKLIKDYSHLLSFLSVSSIILWV